MASHKTSSSYLVVSQVVFSMAKMIHLVMSGCSQCSYDEFCVNATNSNAKATKSIAAANGTNSTAKVTNSTANRTKSIAKVTNSIAKTCNNPLGIKYAICL